MGHEDIYTYRLLSHNQQTHNTLTCKTHNNILTAQAHHTNTHQTTPTTPTTHKITPTIMHCTPTQFNHPHDTPTTHCPPTLALDENHTQASSHPSVYPFRLISHHHVPHRSCCGHKHPFSSYMYVVLDITLFSIQTTAIRSYPSPLLYREAHTRQQREERKQAPQEVASLHSDSLFVDVLGQASYSRSKSSTQT